MCHRPSCYMQPIIIISLRSAQIVEKRQSWLVVNAMSVGLYDWLTQSDAKFIKSLSSFCVVIEWWRVDSLLALSLQLESLNYINRPKYIKQYVTETSCYRRSHTQTHNSPSVVTSNFLQNAVGKSNLCYFPLFTVNLQYLKPQTNNWIPANQLPILYPRSNTR